MLPNISILIPTYNEEGFIKDCVESLVCNSYPIDKIETLIIDGGSTDNTVQIITSLQSLYPQIKLLSNPKKTVPSAMNIGAQQASHPILIWCGSHAKYGRDYLKNSVEILLTESECASIGGVITPIATTFVGQAIASATCHKFGIGNALYRYATKRSIVDTVFGGCFYKSSVDAVGGFNEEWVRNQDYEFNYRLRTQVGNIILDPSIMCEYYCRESIPKLAHQYFQYGYWRFRTLQMHPHSLTLRQTAPLLLILGLLGSLILLLSGNSFGFLIPASYLTINLIASISIILKEKKAHFISVLPVIFATLHLSWGAGFIISAIETSYNRLSKQIKL